MMSRATLKRLDRLEETMTPPARGGHFVLGYSKAELDRNEAALRASGALAGGGTVIRFRIVRALDGRPAPGQDGTRIRCNEPQHAQPPHPA
jgi:hypothetical protein